MNTAQIDDVLVIELPARLDANTVASLDGEIQTLVTAHKGKTLVDLSQVSFVASLALRMLLTAQKTVKPLGGDLRLAGLQPQIAEIFRKSRFDTLFTIYPDRETGLAGYQ